MIDMEIKNLLERVWAAAAMNVCAAKYGDADNFDPVAEGTSILIQMPEYDVIKAIAKAASEDDGVPDMPGIDQRIMLGEIYGNADYLHGKILEYAHEHDVFDAIGMFGLSVYGENKAEADKIPGADNEENAGLAYWCRLKAAKCVRLGISVQRLSIAKIVDEIIE